MTEETISEESTGLNEENETIAWDEIFKEEETKHRLQTVIRNVLELWNIFPATEPKYYRVPEGSYIFPTICLDCIILIPTVVYETKESDKFTVYKIDKKHLCNVFLDLKDPEVRKKYKIWLSYFPVTTDTKPEYYFLKPNRHKTKLDPEYKKIIDKIYSRPGEKQSDKNRELWAIPKWDTENNFVEHSNWRESCPISQFKVFYEWINYQLWILTDSDVKAEKLLPCIIPQKIRPKKHEQCPGFIYTSKQIKIHRYFFTRDDIKYYGYREIHPRNTCFICGKPILKTNNKGRPKTVCDSTYTDRETRKIKYQCREYYNEEKTRRYRERNKDLIDWKNKALLGGLQIQSHKGYGKKRGHKLPESAFEHGNELSFTNPDALLITENVDSTGEEIKGRLQKVQNSEYGTVFWLPKKGWKEYYKGDFLVTQDVKTWLSKMPIDKPTSLDREYHRREQKRFEKHGKKYLEYKQFLKEKTKNLNILPDGLIRRNISDSVNDLLFKHYKNETIYGNKTIFFKFIPKYNRRLD